MGIDTRQSRNGRNDRNKYYKAEYVEKNTLKVGAKCQGVFYSSDTIDMNEGSVNYANNQFERTNVTIETTDNVTDLKEKDFVEYNGKLYLVEEITKADLDKSKRYSNRPPAKTTIKLRR